MRTQADTGISSTTHSDQRNVTCFPLQHRLLPDRPSQHSVAPYLLPDLVRAVGDVVGRRRPDLPPDDGLQARQRLVLAHVRNALLGRCRRQRRRRALVSQDARQAGQGGLIRRARLDGNSADPVVVDCLVGLDDDGVALAWSNYLVSVRCAC